ncbi:MAG: hypothetical protein Q4B87_03115, partial [Candidatus Saccharibacteria bacterium]|nr:hypothetical protein [Candidatus Saccharibacteria bacterium]
VAEINGDWWMTRNLAIGCSGSGTSYGSRALGRFLSSTYSNVSSSWSTPTAGLSNGGSNDTPYITCSSSYGAWYNYVAASAGTITGESNNTEDIYNVCPKGWTLPTLSQLRSIIGYHSAFSPVTGGHFHFGTSPESTGNGYWWSATVDNAATRYYLGWTGSKLYTGSSHNRANGDYIRCIRSS